MTVQVPEKHNQHNGKYTNTSKQAVQTDSHEVFGIGGQSSESFDALFNFKLSDFKHIDGVGSIKAAEDSLPQWSRSVTCTPSQVQVGTRTLTSQNTNAIHTHTPGRRYMGNPMPHPRFHLIRFVRCALQVSFGSRSISFYLKDIGILFLSLHNSLVCGPARWKAVATQLRYMERARAEAAADAQRAQTVERKAVRLDEECFFSRVISKP
eukprot:5087426-Amphidinium_carterae.1